MSALQMGSDVETQKDPTPSTLTSVEPLGHVDWLGSLSVVGLASASAVSPPVEVGAVSEVVGVGDGAIDGVSEPVFAGEAGVTSLSSSSALAGGGGDVASGE